MILNIKIMLSQVREALVGTDEDVIIITWTSVTVGCRRNHVAIKVVVTYKFSRNSNDGIIT